MTVVRVQELPGCLYSTLDEQFGVCCRVQELPGCLYSTLDEQFGDCC